MRAAILSSLLALTVGTSGPAELQPSQTQQDFDVLRRAVEEAHGSLYRFTAKPELDRQFDRARTALDRPMSTLAFAGIVSEALAYVRDGHMRLEYDEATTTALAAARLVPVRLVSERGRLVVTGNDTSGDSTIQPGMELLSVNGRTVADIIKTILPKLSGDGFIETGKAFRMARNFAQNYWLFIEQAETFLVTARTKDGSTVKATLEGITTADRAKSANPVNATMVAKMARLDGSKDAVSLQFPRGHDVAWLRVKFFDGDTFESSLAAAFSTVREKGAKAVVLDLRGNGGGVDLYGAALVSQFVSKPFRYFKHIKVTTIRPSFATWKVSTYENLKTGTIPAPDGGFLVLPALHRGVEEQKPAASPFLGRVFVLIDGGTFSTAADVCAQLRSLTKATFIGEETAGSADGNTSGLNASIVLPNSGLKLKVQMYGYWNEVTGSKHGRGTLPDREVLRTVDDVLAGKDSALELAVSLAAK
jgi:C-terminal processing protease CtpA/Prc